MNMHRALFPVAAISCFLASTVERKVSGGRLTLRFSDIDLAGHYHSREGAVSGLSEARFDLLACRLRLYCKIVPGGRW